ncbi:hypothetical protein F5Y15DRAFT_164755 [Xylariaceae sp. FL0016]|nr:hypothetical protein F5Y15DRAFT_164755 [Xylariaceae sp. FL0016]
MAPKRPADGQPAAPSTKRRRDQASFKSNNGAVDPNYGQRGAFGDLQDGSTVPGDSDLDCEDDSEALAYLRSVRVQASGIPHVIVAKKAGPSRPPESAVSIKKERIGDGYEEDDTTDRSIYMNGTGDFRGYYQDGAYVAYPKDHWDVEDEYEEDYEEGDVDADSDYDEDEDYNEESSDGRPNSNADEIRDAYFTSLTSRFLASHEMLRREPPKHVLKALSPNHPTDFANRKKWWSCISFRDPLPAQVAGMHKDTVLHVLRLIVSDRYLRKKYEVSERTSRWLWALLARLPEKGELDYQEIGVIRDLGKRAVLLMVSLTELEILKENCDVGASSHDSHDEGGVDDDGWYEDDCQGEACDFDDSAAPTNDLTHDCKDASKNAIEEKCQKTTAAPETDTVKAMGNSTNPRAVETHESSDVEMQIDDESDLDEGEVSDTAPAPSTRELDTDMAAAKARLLRQLDENNAAGEAEDAKSRADREARERSRINQRATLNMILTVAGEFFGQRDLLEFRDPFGGLHIEG